MKADHLNRGVVERFVEGELPSEDARRIERHLSICSDCRDLADQVSFLAKLQVLDSWLHPGYDEAFERAASGAAERLENLVSEARNTDDLLVELLRENAAVRRVKIRREERFHSLKLCQVLRKRSRENWFLDPAVALELADLAVVVAQYLDSARYGSSLVEDSRALSLAYLGNAFRITSDLRQADQALREAWIHHIEAGEDFSTETKLLNLTCSLRGAQDRLKEAERLCDRAIAIHRETQDRHLEGATMIHKALILGYGGRFQEAIPLVRAGLFRINKQRDQRLVLLGKLNLINLLSRSGQPERARGLLNERDFLIDGQRDRLILSWRWVEGHIAGGLGRLAEAEDLLLGVRDALVDCNCGVEVFSVSLDLAHIYAQSSQPRKAKEILCEVIPLGEALGLRRDVFLARLLYGQVART